MSNNYSLTNIKEIKIKNLEDLALRIRKDIIDATYKVSLHRGKTHIGGSLSMCEILSVLYGKVLKVSKDNLKSQNRNRFILSKGHGALALYAALKEVGIISLDDFLSFKDDDSHFWTHPTFSPKHGLEFASGSLGIGISLAVGTALALKLKGNSSKVYCLVGDGECDEGEVWEALSFANHHQLNNLTVIVDDNNMQLDDFTSKIVDKSNLAKRIESFGFNVVEVDGHDIESLDKAFVTSHDDMPLAVIAHTIKGKGVSFIENNPTYHTGSLTKEQYEQALAEIGISADDINKTSKGEFYKLNFKKLVTKRKRVDL